MPHSPNQGLLKNPSTTTVTMPKGASKALMPTQKINQHQMKEMRDKVLGYCCDFKWNPSHKCFNPKLFF